MPSLQRLILPWFMAARALVSPVTFGVLGAVDDGAGKILLVRQSYAKGWMLPGGGVDRGELPERAVLRELQEEIGLTSAGQTEFFALYTRPAGWATNVVVLYRLRNAAFSFKPGFEIREIQWVDPSDPPGDVAHGTKRRLAELVGKAPLNGYW